MTINGLRPTHIIIDDPIISQGNTMIIKHVRHEDNANKIRFSNGAYALFSYDTLVLFFDGKIEYVDEYKYSRTTTKHISQYSQPIHSLGKIYVSHKELQQKLQIYMTNHVVKNILGEVI